MDRFTPHTLRFERTRIAPTPSGYLHLGNILSFVLTVSLARRHGAKILLRIDDLDRERAHPAFVQDIFDTLHFLELPWDEGPRDTREFNLWYSQQNRMGLYRDALNALAATDRVFACTCSRTDLLRNNPSGFYSGTCRSKAIPKATCHAAWRLRTSEPLTLIINTLQTPLVHEGLPSAMQEFIVKRRDGLPAYQLSSVVDDVHFGVDFIVRGADLWPSTLAQHYLASVLKQQSFNRNCFHHHQLLLGEGGVKLSKSAGASSVYGLRKDGKKRSEVYQHLGLLLGIGEEVCDWQSLAAHLDNALPASMNIPAALNT